MFFDNEEKVKKTNEKIKRENMDEMYAYGYKENKSTFLNTPEYDKLLLEFIKNKNLFIYNFDLPSRTTKVIRKNANKGLLMQIGDIDRNVLYNGNCKKLVYDFEGKTGQKLDKTCIDEFIQFAVKASSQVDVTKIPIEWDSDQTRNAFEGTFYYYTNYMENTEALKRCPVISFGLKMVNQNDDLGSPTLAHEMTHALVNRNKGIIENLKNVEVLSIYMELVVAYELDETGSLLHKMMLSRLQSLKNDMLNSYKDVYNGYFPFTEYIDSSLYAFSLFEKYKNGSEKVRKAIRKEINKTLLGKRTLEDTLQVLDASQKEGSQIIQDYVKKIMK